MSERLALQQSIVCKMGCSSPKVLGPTRSAMSIVPPINPKYSIGPLPSDIFVIITQCEGSVNQTFRLKKL